MKGRSFFAVLLLTLFSGCESYINRSFANRGRGAVDNERRIAAPASDGYVQPNGPAQQEAADRTRPETTRGPAVSGRVPPPSSGSAGKPDLAALPVGTPCRIDLVRPPGQGQAYEGTIVRVRENEIVLSNVISEGPMKRSRAPSLADLPSLASGRFGGGTSIDWQRLPDHEVRIAKSEISAVRVLDHDPIADFYER
jgi:hypothetical protein